MGTLHPCKEPEATLNETCRTITGCLKPTRNCSLPVLDGIAPPDFRNRWPSRTGRTGQTTDQRPPLNSPIGVVSRLKSRKSFIKCSGESINKTAKDNRIQLWREQHEPMDACVHLISVLTNTSQLAQRTPELDHGPGKHLVPPRGTKAHMVFLIGLCM